MESANFSTKMVVYMMVNGKKIKCMEKEYYIMLPAHLHMMGKNLIIINLENGLKTNLKVLEFYITKIQKNLTNLSIIMILILLKNCGRDMMENSETIIKY